MKSIEEILDVEEEYAKRGERSLGRAIAYLSKRWLHGCTDRDTALHLVFLTWYSLLEPPRLTGANPTQEQLEAAASTIDYFIEFGADKSAKFVLNHLLDSAAWAMPGEASNWRDVVKTDERTHSPTTNGVQVLEERGLIATYFASFT